MKRIAVLTTFITILMISFIGAFQAHSQTRRKLIIDQDSFGPGGSNMQAILMALQSPDVEVMGITVESGDGWQDENVAHVLRMLEIIGRTDIPVVSGATYPLINTREATKHWEEANGKLDYTGAWMNFGPAYNGSDRTPYHTAHEIPPMAEGIPSTRPLGVTAAHFLVREVHAFPGQITIMALGPFTNIALAESLDDRFAGLAKELVCASGSFSSEIDRDSGYFPDRPRTEFNNRWDPEAAHIMLRSHWKALTIRPTDATFGTEMTKAQFEKVSTCGTKASQYIAGYPDRKDPMWDEVAVAVWLDPSLIRDSSVLFVDVNISRDDASYGNTLSWTLNNAGSRGLPTAHVVRRINIRAFHRLFEALICRGS